MRLLAAIVVVATIGCGKSSREAPPPPIPLDPPPVVSTPPPVATFEEAAPPVPTGRSDETRDASTAPSSSALGRAQRAALEGRSGEVRALLEAKVRSGHASLDEARLLRAACKDMHDAKCKDDIDAKYPGLVK